MYRLFGLSLVAVFALGPAARADDAQAIIDKALKVHGGAENIAKYNASTWKGKGKFYGLGEGIEYSGEWTTQGKDQARISIEGEVMGQKFNQLIVINGNKGWMKVMGMEMDLEGDQLAEQLDDLYAEWVSTLIPFARKEKGFTLTPLGESKVEGKPVVGVKVSAKDRRDINLYFDKESGLLAKTEYRVKDSMAGQEVNQESFVSDYKDIDGIQQAMKVKIHRDGKLYVDGEVTSLKREVKVDEGIFAKP